jgi:pyruvate dehydrogenase E2 component (dihydrolipoamide acetyltransferase)
VHALDLPGHGQSSPTYGKGSIRALSEAVIAAMDALNIQRAHLVGHSMGGAIALLLGATKPDRVASVTGVSPGGLGPELNRVFIDGFIAANSRKQMQDVLGLLFARPDSVSRQMIEEALQYKRLDGTVEALTAIAEANFTSGGQKSGLRELLPAMTVPVQIIWGRLDRIIPVSQSEGLSPPAKVAVFDGVGHMAHMERATDVNDLIATFVAQQT